ncbi:hypothetical protein [uncultured Ilumatobacter sp.]|jgi:hypothetical protein|uniref:hypothetical protein n=1 Tax=Ilumatobacter sp. TaxID=1967498 RepID=UPI00309CF6F8|tara:strand:- start:237 stop:494 length:258 start_codon:yes stop_codon:yes gene_type:complete
MAVKKPILSPWFNGETPLEELPASDQVAHDIVLEFSDLKPSITRIMEADLDDDQRLNAMVAFRDSLQDPGNPNRDPRVAITNAGG